MWAKFIVKKVLLHEVAGHLGLRKLFSGEFDRFLFSIAQTHSDEVAKIAADRNLDISNEAGLLEAAEEFVATFAENGTENTIWQRIAAAFRNFLRNLGFDLEYSDSELRSLLSRGLRNLQGSVVKENLTTDGGVRFAVNGNGRPYYDIPFAESVDRVIDPANKTNREPVFVSETPLIFKKVGFTALPMMMNQRHLRLNYFTKKEFEERFGKMDEDREHAHGLHDEIKKLKASLEHPLAIVVNQSKNATPGSVVAITNIDVNGKKVVVPILIEAKNRTTNGEIDLHLVLTVYDSKDWVKQFLKPALDIEKQGKVGVFYFDPKKAEQYEASRALAKRLTGTGHTPGVLHNIADTGIKVKQQIETLQFKKFFQDSKVVDADGKPLVVYHGTNWQGWEFDQSNVAWFSEKEDYAEEMAAQRNGNRTIKAYLSIQNPMFVKVPPNKMADPAYENKIIAEAKAKGHDGVRFETDTNNEIERDVFWVAFDPAHQVKSATDNIGTFDVNNPDIRYSVANDGGFRSSDPRKEELWAKFIVKIANAHYINTDAATALLLDHGIRITPRDEQTLVAACVIARNMVRQRNRKVRAVGCAFSATPGAQSH